MTYTITPADSSSSDAEELVALVEELQRTQREEDADGFLDLFDDDAVWVTGGGRRLIGKDVISAFTRQVLPGFAARGSVRYVVEHIRFLSPDLALTGVDQEALTRDGAPLSPRQEGRPSYLWLRTDGRWRIAAGQNTAVPMQA
ncbi:EcaC [Brachybacterium phenoliresistens]|uniref:EcaC n=1 Tax=Brachybacterium phenoliresistens TaxID=396014 RepID=Z9JUT6_9MICO|nr:SgcJ/EcaC family oxidoreductase [Brachybacterium phenoliresistens]EWS81813.1 EcaC [Brachybacterium phenoliresistens]